MPAALATLVLMPLGLEGLALPVMVGHRGDGVVRAAGRSAARRGDAHPGDPHGLLALMVAGGLWLLFRRTRLRLCGLADRGRNAGALGAAPRRPGGPRRPARRGARRGRAARRAAGAALGLRARALARARRRRALAPGSGARSRLPPGDAAGCTVEVRGATVAVAFLGMPQRFPTTASVPASSCRRCRGRPAARARGSCSTSSRCGWPARTRST